MIAVTIKLNEKEHACLQEMCTQAGMTEVGVIRQALRVYQRVTLASPEVREAAMKLLGPDLGPGGCMGDD